MAWRFKASKYKNAAPIVPKPEVCIRDVCVGSYQTYGNNICASASVMAFNWEHVGSSLAVLPLDDCGRKSKTMPLLHAHSDTITDMEFSPFHDGLLATGSQDCLVKLWHIPSTGLTESLTSPECTLSQRQRRVETVGFNPAADGLLHVTSAAVLSLWDLMTQQEAFVNNDHGDVIQSASWRRDGRILATSCKDKKVRIVDPRAASPLVGSASSHQSIKDSRVVWLGDQERILTTGFDAARLRQVIIRDVRNLSSPEKTLELDCSTGVLMPLYDADTCMLFLAGKGDTTIAYMEVCDREPYLIEGIRHSGEQTKGACLVPKRALRVMEGEVNRVLQLTSSMVVPIMYQVPRKTYRDYHTDLYPDTPGFVTHTNSSMWLKGVDHSVPKMSLDPAKRGPESSEKVHRGPLAQYVKQLEAMVDPSPKPLKSINSPPTALIKPQAKVQPMAEQPDIVKDSENSSRIDFINVKDMIKGMEKPKNEDKINKKIELQVEAKNTVNAQPEKQQATVVAIIHHQKNDDDIKKCIIKPQREEPKIHEFNDQIDCCNDMPESDQINVDLMEEISSANIEDDFEINNEVVDHKSNGHFEDDVISVDNPVLNNGSSNGSCPIVPKPMPRSSISEGGAGEEGHSNINIVNGVPRPVAKPRTSTQHSIGGGYKPRLGPKPFSSSQGSQEFSFDRVFSVPAAPGTQPSSGSQEFLPESQHQNNGCPSPPVSDSAPSSLSPNKQKTSPVKANSNSSPKEAPLDNFASGDKASPTSDVEATPNKDGDYQNGKSDSSIEEEVNSSDSGYKPKTPSTAERRKMFEVKPNSKDGTDGLGAEDAFDDTAVGNQRCSIAERRRLYENRSVSVQETASVAMIAAKEAAAEVAQASPTPLRRRDSLKSRRSPEPEDKRASVPNPSTKRTSTVFGRVSKFRHLKGTPGHKSTHIENIKNVSRQISGECDGFHANPHRVAVPLGGGGGRVAVLELKAAGRLADGVTPALLHPNALCDWQWDPFNHSRLIVACDDGIIREWIIPEEGLSEPTNSPANTFAAHSDKIYLVKFHPCASDVLTTAAHDLTVKLWDLASGGTERLALTGHKDQIFALAWSPCGGYLATVAKDGLIRVYKPRTSDAPIREGKGPVGSRGARVVWALNGSHIVVTGFDKVSERQIMVFDAKDLSTPLNTIGLDVSPAILIPFYDEDSSTLFLTGRGDSTIYCFEVTSEAPHLCPLSHHRCPSLHQGLSFLSKQQCAVQRVEFAKALRLTNTTIEPLSFTVPRIKSELFQDDLFPPTKVSWLPTCSSKEWFSGVDKAAPRLSLQPAGMDTLSGSVTPTPITPTSNAPVASNKISNNQPFNRLGWNPEMAGVAKAKQDEIQKSLAARIEVNMTLEQDSMEGVDESEWDQ